MQNLTGKTIDRYHILEQIGEGGMAVVYKAYDTRLHTEVAFKIIQTDAFPTQSLDRMLARFKREAQTLAKLQHSNIVGIIDYGEYEQTPYLVMEYLPGGSLKQILGKALPFKEAASLLLPIADALAHAHKQGIIHRDIKPSNILFSVSRDPMLTDFGIAKLIEDADENHTLTGTGVGIGTPEYMAPEQGLGKPIDGRADIYSLGIIFYELITGQKPYSAETPMAVILKHMTDPLPNPSEMVPGLPPQVVKVLLKALAKNPKNRYKNIADFTKALELLMTISDEEITRLTSINAKSARNNRTQDKPTKTVQRNRLRKLAWGICGVILIIFTAFVFFRNHLFPIINEEAFPTNSVQYPSTISATLIPTSKTQVGAIISNSPTSILTKTLIPTKTAIPTTVNPFQTINESNVKVLSLELVLPYKEQQFYEYLMGAQFSFSPDSGTIATYKNKYTDSPNNINIFSTDTGNLKSEIKTERNRYISCMEISDDGNLLAVGDSGEFGQNKQGNYSISIWDLKSQSLSHELIGHFDAITSISFSPDNLTLASGSIDNTIVVWDLRSGNQLQKINTIKSAITTIQYSPDGKTLAATGSADSTIYLFQVSDKALKGHNGKVQSIAFSPDGKYLASHGTARSTEIWDIQNEKIIQTILDDRADFKLGSADIAFSADGQIIAIVATGDLNSNMKTTFWKVSDGSYLASILSPLYWSEPDIEFSKDGNIFAVNTNKLGGGIGLYKIRANTTDKLFKGENIFIDSTIRLTANNQLAYVANKEGVSVFDANTGKLLNFLDLSYWIDYGYENNCKLQFACTMEISLDGSRILLRTTEKEAAVYDNKGTLLFAITFADIENYTPPYSCKYDVHLSQDGKYLSINKIATEGPRIQTVKEFQIINIITKQVVLAFNKGGELVNGTNPLFSPENQYLITTIPGKQPHSYLWNISDGTLVKHYTDTGSYVFSRDSSKIILINGSKIAIRSLPGNEIIKTISMGDLLYPQIVALSRNESYLALYKGSIATGDELNGKLYIYNLDNGTGDKYGESISIDKLSRIVLENDGTYRIFMPTDNN